MRLSLRNYRLLQAVIMVGTAVFLLDKIVRGTLFWYINERYTWLMVLAALGLFGLAFAVLPQFGRKDDTGYDYQASGDFDNEHASPSALGLLVLASPLIFGLLVPARPLGTTALSNKEVNTIGVVEPSAGQAIQFELASTDRSILDWIVAFNYSPTPEDYEGQIADVTGFVFNDSSLPDSGFLLGRFTVSCCVADASAVAVMVVPPNGEQFDDNVWLRATGPITSTERDGELIPVIYAELVEEIDVPNNPYLYP